MRRMIKEGEDLRTLDCGLPTVLHLAAGLGHTEVRWGPEGSMSIVVCKGLYTGGGVEEGFAWGARCTYILYSSCVCNDFDYSEP
jgi:hypothetical protein